MTSFSAFGLCVLSISVLLVGYMSLRQFLFCLRFGLASLRWPSVKGKIVHSALADIPLPAFRQELKQPVEYEYSVNGKPYHSEQLSYNHSLLVSPLSRKKEQRIKSLAVGTEIEVYYDPECPINAVLVTGVGLREVVSNFVAGAASIAGGTALLIIGVSSIA